MKNINERLNYLYKNENYNEYIKSFYEYLNSGYSISFDMIIHYLYVLIKLRKFDEAYNISMNLKKYICYDYNHSLAKILYYCYKVDDALEILFSYSEHLPKDDYLLAKIYMLKGDLITAKSLFKKMLNNPLFSDVFKDAIRKNIQKINNNIKYNAFVEIEYRSFLEKGNILVPGYIVYIKNDPLLVNGSKDNNDLKSNSRPYLIWKIENDIVYMFPISKNCSKAHYYLFFQNYPNSECDRTIKNNLSITTIDNIISIYDKVLESDYKIIISNLFVTTYSSHDMVEKEGRRKFLEEYVGIPKINDVISYYVNEEKKSHFYLVLNILENEYEVIELNHTLTETIGKKILIPKERFIFSIRPLPDNSLIEQTTLKRI